MSIKRFHFSSLVVATAVASLAPISALALNKCMVNGKTVYQDAPCGLDSQKAEPVKVWDNRLVDGGGKVHIGMAEEDVLRAWGKPDHVNTTISKGGVSKQLVYGTSNRRQYLYIREGVLTTIQSPE